MGDNNIDLKSVGELIKEKKKFFIPSYQRGYRWTSQQVEDLLNDVWEFSRKERSASEFYCLQPLVVKKDGEQYIVIDGQQRLTTIYLVLKYLNNNLYGLEYETRPSSKEFLLNIDKNTKDNNIDFFNIFNSYETILKWFLSDEMKKDKAKQIFKEKLCNYVKFIWYEPDESDKIKIFTRLNVGKIPLTNAELIKALFLREGNFSKNDVNTDEQKESIELKRLSRAVEWDNIEHALQNDEFWLFLNSTDDIYVSRIDFIFDLIYDSNLLKLQNNSKIGDAKDKTFRYFFEYIKINNDVDKIESVWSEVKSIFNTFQEWFNDLEFYHYVGFLIDQNENVSDLLKEWKSQTSRKSFVDFLIDCIKSKIKNCVNLNAYYEIENSKAKRHYPKKATCKSVLLLHNIQTVINQGKGQKEDDKYKMSVFYKFPFHLYKKEKWDVEHISSATENDLDDLDSQKEWIKQCSEFLDIGDKKNDIEKFLNDKKWDDDGKRNSLFEKLYSYCIKKLAINESGLHDDKVKNKIWNYALLDNSTNRSYKNAIFAFKRKTIIEKDQGKKSIAFIPPCTKNVFLKYYNTNARNLLEWTKEDAKAYMTNIYETLKDFGVTYGGNK